MRRPSGIFLGLLAVFAGFGALLWQLTDRLAPATGVVTFVFVATGWLISLCLHEFGHAYLAWRAGDTGVADKGYLTLNPLKYSDAALSFVLPMIFLILGGIGLPGGAVYINQGAIRSRIARSLISAAGPAANLLFAFGLALLISNLWSEAHLTFWIALSFLAFLQVTAALINLLPVPGLDGFGILQPWLPARWVRRSMEWSVFAFIGVIALLWFPPVNQVFFDFVFGICSGIGIDPLAADFGLRLFRFWSEWI